MTESSMYFSASGVKLDDPGNIALHWKAVLRVQPCCVKRFRTVVCV